MNNNKYNSDAVQVVGFENVGDNIKAHYEGLVKLNLAVPALTKR